MGILRFSNWNPLSAFRVLLICLFYCLLLVGYKINSSLKKYSDFSPSVCISLATIEDRIYLSWMHMCFVHAATFLSPEPISGIKILILKSSIIWKHISNINQAQLCSMSCFQTRWEIFAVARSRHGQARSYSMSPHVFTLFGSGVVWQWFKNFRFSRSELFFCVNCFPFCTHFH